MKVTWLVNPLAGPAVRIPPGSPKHHLKHRYRLGTAVVMSHRCKTTAAPGCVRQSRLSCYFHASQSVAALRCGRLSPAHDHGTAGPALNCLQQLTHCYDLFMSSGWVRSARRLFLSVFCWLCWRTTVYSCLTYGPVINWRRPWFRGKISLAIRLKKSI